MSDHISIRIDNPCAERWTDMRPGKQGRFCASCQKTIVDLTTLSDQQLLAWLASPNRSTCARFHPDQLNSNLLPLSGKNDKWTAFWQVLLAGCLVSSPVEASAQHTPAQETVISRNTFSEKNALTTSSSDSIKGRVIDSGNRKPLAGAAIKYGKYGVVTDDDGLFVIPRDRALEAGILKIYYVGYQTITVNVSNTWQKGETKVFAFAATSEVMGDFVIVTTKRKKSLLTVIKDTLSAVELVKNKMIVYPNPVPRGETVTVALQLDKKGTYNVQLLNVMGALMEEMKIEGNEKAKKVTLPIPANLNAGTYFVRLSHPAMGKVCTREIQIL